MRTALDAWLFSSGWVAIAAAALLAAASAGMGVPPAPAALVLAFAGTLVIYNVDRVRDRQRDAASAPDRTAFVERHRRSLGALTGAAAAVAAGSAWLCGPAVMLTVAAVGVVGLLHRRLKRRAAWKALYLTGAWLAVAVGIPVALGGARHVGWVAAVLGLALLANAIASNLRVGEAAARRGPAPALSVARLAAASGGLLAFVVPGDVRPLAAVPVATLAALIPFRSGERYGLGVVDGALVLGAALALLLG